MRHTCTYAVNMSYMFAYMCSVCQYMWTVFHICLHICLHIWRLWMRQRVFLIVYYTIFSCKLIDCYTSIIHQKIITAHDLNVLYSDITAYFVTIEQLFTLFYWYTVRHFLQKLQTRCGWIRMSFPVVFTTSDMPCNEKPNQESRNYKFPSQMDRSIKEGGRGWARQV